MSEDKLLNFASKRAALLNLSSAWGTDEDGVLLIQLITRIEQLTAEVERLREALAMCVAEMMRASGRLEIIATCKEDRRIVAALSGTCDYVRSALGGSYE